MGASVRFLAVRLGSVEFGLESERVARVVLREDWEGPDPVTLESLLDQDPVSYRHVLVVSGEQGSWSLATASSLVLRVCAAADIHSLPSLLWAPGVSPTASAIVELPDIPPLLVLHQAFLEERVTGHQVASSPEESSTSRPAI